DVLGGGERIRSGSLKDTDRDRGISVEIGIGRIILSRQLDRRDILHPHHGSCRLLDEYVAEFLGAREPTERLHRDLESTGLIDRRLIKDAGRHLYVLALERKNDVGSGETQRLQAVRVKPSTHCVVATTKHDQRTDAVDARQRVGNLYRGIVGNKQRVARLVW